MLNRLRNLRTPTLPPAHYWQEALIVGAVLPLTIAALWLPFGLDLPPTFDAWIYMDEVRAGAAEGQLCVSTIAGRPTVYLPLCIANWITPSSFVGLNLVLWAVMVLKGIGIYFLVRELLPAQPIAAYTAALVVNLIPADTIFLNKVIVVIHTSAACLVGSIALLLVQWRTGFRWLWVPIVVLQGISITMYEGGALVLLAAPALLYIINGERSPRLWRIAGLWMITPLVAMAAFTSRSYLFSDYQTGLVSDTLNPVTWLVGVMRALGYHLGTPYFLDIRPGANTLTLIAVFIATFAVIGLRGRDRERPLPLKPWLVVAGVSIGFIVLGFLPYSVTPILGTRARAFLYSTLSGAVFWGGVIAYIGGIRYGRALQVSVLWILIGGGAYWHLSTHSIQVDLNRTQSTLMNQTIARVGDLPPNAHVVFAGPTTPFVRTSVLSSAVRDAYGTRDTIWFECSEGNLNTENPCAFEEDALYVFNSINLPNNDTPWFTRNSVGDIVYRIPYDNLVVMRYAPNTGSAIVLPSLNMLTPTGRATGYEPGALLIADDAPGISPNFSRVDIPTSPGVTVGDGWYTLERDGDLLWRWLDTNGELLFDNPQASQTLYLRVYAGSSLLEFPNAVVNIVDANNVVVSTATVTMSEQTLAFDLEFTRGYPTVYRVQVEGSSGQRGSPADPRVLNLRVFEVRLLP